MDRYIQVLTTVEGAGDAEETAEVPVEGELTGCARFWDLKKYLLRRRRVGESGRVAVPRKKEERSAENI